MGDPNEGLLAFLGVVPDQRLLDEDAGNLPAAEQYHELAVVTRKHDRLVAVGSLLTGVTLIGGAASRSTAAGMFFSMTAVRSAPWSR